MTLGWYIDPCEGMGRPNIATGANGRDSIDWN